MDYGGFLIISDYNFESSEPHQAVLLFGRVGGIEQSNTG
jgi:hypothetical protein